MPKSSLEYRPRRLTLGAVILAGVFALSSCVNVVVPSPIPTGPAVATPDTPSLSQIAYGPLAQHRLDIYPATASVRRGTIVYVHSGGFVSGDKVDIVEQWSSLILGQRANGFDIVSVNYRLARVAPFPAAFDDVALALSWVTRHGQEHGLSQAQLIVVGHSAGGAIAAMIGTTPGASTQFGSVPLVDKWVGVAAISNFGAVDQLDRDYGADWGLPSAAKWASSPLTNIDRTDPPGYLIHGDHDNVVFQAQSNVFALTAASRGARVEYDRVNSDPLGRPPLECRWHLPLCAANATLLTKWLVTSIT